jgi:hypothetical protein
MKKMFFGVALLIGVRAAAQGVAQPGSASTTTQRIDSVLAEYSERYPQEKIYLQFDRGVYNPGETIWFKAYLLAGLAPGTISRNIYFDWYDGAGKLLKHMTAPVFEASAKGQFDIPAGYGGGALHVRAYTQWMLNFDTAFLYDKTIPVVRPVGVAPGGSRDAREPGPAESAAGIGRRPMQQGAGQTQLGFFPEGGDPVTGLVCKVAFKANDQFGMPVAVSGVVQGSDGSFVDSLTTEHDGMGSFMIRPSAGVQYTASWTDATGKTFSTRLPPAAPSGFAIQVQPHDGQCMVIIRRTSDVATTGSAVDASVHSVYLLAHMDQRVVYAAQVSLEDKPEVAMNVPTADLPTGVLQYTLFDAGWKPVAERVVFVNNQLHSFTARVRVVASSREKRGRNELTIEVPDSAFSNLSVAVTDAGLPHADEDIVSRLLLSDDIRGAIYHPSYYFSGEAPARQLDLVMLTHGWRRFKWADVVAGKLPELRYPRDTNYLVLRGSVVANRVHDLVAGQPLLLILETKDSSRKRLLVPVNSLGQFVQRGMLFYDTMRVYYDFPGNKKLSGAHSVEIGSNLLGPQGDIAEAGVPGSGDAVGAVGSGGPGGGVRSGAFGGAAVADTSGMGRTRFFAGEEAEREKQRQATMLAAVTVNGRVKRPVDVLDEKYATGPFRREAGYQFDVKDDVLALHSTDIFYYLRQVVPGLEVQYKDGYPILKWRQTTPTLFVDEVGMRPDLVADIPITDIAYVKVFHPPFLMGGVINPRAGAIAIYTKKGEDVKPLPTKGLNYKLLEGYAAERQFYSPDYSVDPTGQADFLPDVRPTLYWNPYIFTDANNHTATISFYNNDVSTKLRVVVEGMNAAGKLTRTEMIIQ